MITACQENLISQAKELLIAREHVTEPQAHRLIQKRAMDLRISKTECATQIITRYNQSLEEATRSAIDPKISKTFAQGDNAPLTGVFFNAENKVEEAL